MPVVTIDFSEAQFKEFDSRITKEKKRDRTVSKAKIIRALIGKYLSGEVNLN